MPRLIVAHAEAFITWPQRHIEFRFRHVDANEELIFQLPFLQTPSPSLRDTGLLTRATVRAVRLVSGRDDQALPTVLKTLGRDGLVTPELNGPPKFALIGQIRSYKTLPSSKQRHITLSVSR